MPITRTAIIDDDGSGKTGTAIDNAWKQQLYDQIDAQTAMISARPWANIPGTDIQITNDVGTPLAPVIYTNRYQYLGNNTVLWQLTVNPLPLSVATAVIYLNLTVPKFFILSSTNTAYPVAWGSYPSYLTAAHGQSMTWKRADGQSFPAGNMWLYFSIVLEASLAG